MLWHTLPVLPSRLPRGSASRTHPPDPLPHGSVLVLLRVVSVLLHNSLSYGQDVPAERGTAPHRFCRRIVDTTPTSSCSLSRNDQYPPKRKQYLLPLAALSYILVSLLLGSGLTHGRQGAVLLSDDPATPRIHVGLRTDAELLPGGRSPAP